MNPNPFLPQLEGPQFLGFYISYILIVLFLACLVKIYVRKTENKLKELPILPTLYTPDLYEAAYLRGDCKGVLETIIYNRTV